MHSQPPLRVAPLFGLPHPGGGPPKHREPRPRPLPAPQLAARLWLGGTRRAATGDAARGASPWPEGAEESQSTGKGPKVLRTHVHTHVCVHVPYVRVHHTARACTRVSTRACSPARAFTRTHACIDTCTCGHALTHVHAHSHTRTETHAHAHAHTGTQGTLTCMSTALSLFPLPPPSCRHFLKDWTGSGASALLGSAVPPAHCSTQPGDPPQKPFQ